MAFRGSLRKHRKPARTLEKGMVGTRRLELLTSTVSRHRMTIHPIALLRNICVHQRADRCLRPQADCSCPAALGSRAHGRRRDEFHPAARWNCACRLTRQGSPGWFQNRFDARRKISAWQTEYNEVARTAAWLPNPEGVWDRSCDSELRQKWSGARGLKSRPPAPQNHPVKCCRGTTKTYRIHNCARYGVRAEAASYDN